MAFTLPTFNLTCGIQTNGSLGAFRLTSPCNLASGRRVAGSLSTEVMELLLPALTDIRDTSNASGNDHVECPVGTGRWYFVEVFDDVAKGFANEYRLAVLTKSPNPITGAHWPTPTP